MGKKDKKVVTSADSTAVRLAKLEQEVSELRHQIDEHSETISELEEELEEPEHKTKTSCNYCETSDSLDVVKMRRCGHYLCDDCALEGCDAHDDD